MMTQITGGGAEQMRLLAARIRQADPAFKRELLRRFRDASRPVTAAAVASIESMPSHHDGTLRGEVAKTIRASVGVTRSDVRLDITSLGSRMPRGETNLPAYLDSAKGWSHPVYAQGPRFHLGRSHAAKYRRRPAALRPMVKRGSWTWVHQMGKPEWFEGAIGPLARGLQRDVSAAMEETKRKLGG